MAAAAAALPFFLISLLLFFFISSTTQQEQGQGQVPSSVTPKAAAVHYWHLKTHNNKPLPPVILSKLSPLSPTKLIATTDETMRAMSERPYDKYASQERPYDKYAPHHGHATTSDDAESLTIHYTSDSNSNVKMATGDEVKEKAAEQNDPRGIFSQDRPYDKYASQDRRPYDKYASQERPYDKYASQYRRPYDKYASQERPYDKYASQDRRPYDKYASQEQRPYDKYASQEQRPYDKYASQDRRPYDKYASQEQRPYDKYASQEHRPYDKYASQQRPYDKYASHDLHVTASDDAKSSTMNYTFDSNNNIKMVIGDEVKAKAAEQNDPQGIFFRESELKEGKTIPLLKFESRDSSHYFLPRSIASKIPLSASAVSKIFHIPTDSAMYRAVKNTIGHCRMPPNTGETNQCVMSAEDLIDYALSTMGENTDIQVWSTHSSSGFGGKSLIGKVKVVYDGELTVKQHLACHQVTFPYLVYHCHSVSNTRVYDMEILDGETKEKINQGVALCHLDTSAWDPDHMSFAELGSAPGKTEVCHWIHPWDMTLTASAIAS